MCRSPNLSALNFPKLAAVCPTVVTKSIQVPPPRTQMPFRMPGLAHETSTRSLHTLGRMPTPGGACLLRPGGFYLK